MAPRDLRHRDPAGNGRLERADCLWFDDPQAGAHLSLFPARRNELPVRRRAADQSDAQQRPAVSGGIALVISLLYACLDEVHQSIVPGRAAQLQDVGIDAIGFVLAIVLCTAIWYLTLLIKQKKAVNDCVE